MDALLWLGIVSAVLVMIISAIVTIAVAFRQSVLWGLAYLLVPFAGLVFIVLHWPEARKSVLVTILSGLVAIGGIKLLPDGALARLPGAARQIAERISRRRSRRSATESTNGKPP